MYTVVNTMKKYGKEIIGVSVYHVMTGIQWVSQGDYFEKFGRFKFTTSGWCVC